MLIIKSWNENEIAAILENVNGCMVIKDTEETNKGRIAPEVKPGTCSACEHFTSRRSENGRDKFVKWGFCNKINANVNEHRQACSMMGRKEDKVEEQEVKRIHVA